MKQLTNCFIILIALGFLTILIFQFLTNEFLYILTPFLSWHREFNLFNFRKFQPPIKVNRTEELYQEIPQVQETPPKWPGNSITNRDLYHANPLKVLQGPAVLIVLQGGIGNQLFKYACHYALALSNGWPLYVFINSKTNMNRTWGTGQREFALDLFNIPLGEWNTIDETWNVSNKIIFTDSKMLAGEIPQGSFVYEQSAVDFCQSEVFFSPYKSEILDLFWPLKPPQEDWAWKIKSVGESVAVHFRRGDYVRLNSSVPLQFFKNAMEEIVNLLEVPPTFFLFSDDIAYVQEHFMTDDIFKSFDFNNVYSVSNPEVTTSYQELQLMSLCKHQIISFSSFSWWGAYLNRNPGKIVIAAKPPDELIKWIYGANEFFVWEYRHIYYPIEWKVRDVNWTAHSS